MPLRQLPCCVVMTLWVKTRRPPLAFIIVQTVCKQLSVQKWMKSRAKFPPRPGVCPEGLTHKVIPSTGSQSLFWVCVWKLYNEAACVCLELQMECEEDNGRQESTSMTLRRRKLPRRQEELTPSTAAVAV